MSKSILPDVGNVSIAQQYVRYCLECHLSLYRSQSILFQCLEFYQYDHLNGCVDNFLDSVKI